MTGSAERAGAACIAARGLAADGGTAPASRRSAAAAAVPLPLKPVPAYSAVSSALHARPASSRPALCCVIATVPRSGGGLLSEALSNPPNGVFSVNVHWHRLVWLYGALAPGAFFTCARAAELVEASFSPLQYVFLWRRDTARQAISYYRVSRAQKRLANGKAFDSDPVDLQQIRWFEDEIIEHRQNWRRYFAAGGIEPIEVRYEDLVSAYEETVALLLSRLGIPSAGRLALDAQRLLRRPADDRTEAILEAYLPMRDHLAPKGPDVSWDASGKRFAASSLLSGTPDF